MAGIKESKEVINFLKVFGEVVKECKKDGVINLLDLPKVIPLIGAGKVAFEGSEQVSVELKDLSAEETTELLKDVMVASMVLWQAVSGNP